LFIGVCKESLKADFANTYNAIMLLLTTLRPSMPIFWFGDQKLFQMPTKRCLAPSLAPDGTVTTCELQENQDTCCIDLDGPRIPFSAEITAEPCPWACIWLVTRPELAKYCQELF